MAELQRIRVNETVRPVEGAVPRGFASVAQAGEEVARVSQFVQGKANEAFAFAEDQLGDLAARSVTIAKAERDYRFNVDGQQLTIRDPNHVVRPFIPPGISVFDQKYRKAVQTQYENELETGGRLFLTKLAIDNNTDPVKFLALAEQYIQASTESTGLDTKSMLWNDLTRSATSMYHGLAQQKAARDYRKAVQTATAETELGYRDLSRMANAGLSPLQVTPEGVVDNKDVVGAVQRTLTGIYRKVELGESSEEMAQVEAKRVFDLWAVEQVQGQLTSAHDRLVKQGLKDEALQLALEGELQKLISGDTRVMYPDFNQETGEIKLRPVAIGDVVGADQLPKLQQSLRGVTRAYQELSTQSRQIRRVAAQQKMLEEDHERFRKQAAGEPVVDTYDAAVLAAANSTDPVVAGEYVRGWQGRASLSDQNQRRAGDVVQAEMALPHLKAIFLELGSSEAIRERFPELFTPTSLESLEERVASFPEREAVLRRWITMGQAVLSQGKAEIKLLGNIQGRIDDVARGLAPKPVSMDMASLRDKAVRLEGGWRNPYWVTAFTPGSELNVPEMTAVVPMSFWQGLRGFLQGAQPWDEGAMRHAQQLASLIVKEPMLKDQAGASWAMGESGMRALHYLAASANVGKLVSDPKEREHLNRIMSDQKIHDPLGAMTYDQRRYFYKTVDSVLEKAGGDVPLVLRSDILQHLEATVEYTGMDESLIKGTVEGYTRRLIEEGSYGPSKRTIPLGGPRQANEKRWSYAPIELRYTDNDWLDKQLSSIGKRLSDQLDASNVPAGVRLTFSGRGQNAWVVPEVRNGKLVYGIAMTTQETRAGEKPMLTPVVTGTGQVFTFDLDDQWETYQKLQTAEELERLERKHRRIVEREPVPQTPYSLGVE